LVWVIAKLTYIWHIQIELTGSMVGCGSEVGEVSKSPSHSFCELDDTVDGLDGSGGQLGVEVGEDAIQILTNGLGQMAEGGEAAARCPTTPPPEFSFGKLAVGVCVNGLESLAQSHRAAKLSVLATEVFPLRLTLRGEIPSVAAYSPHRPFELGSLALQLEAHLLEGFAGQHHDVELVEDDAGLRKVLARTFNGCSFIKMM